MMSNIIFYILMRYINKLHTNLYIHVVRDFDGISISGTNMRKSYDYKFLQRIISSI